MKPNDECYCGDPRDMHSEHEPHPCKEVGCDCPYFDFFGIGSER